MTSVLPDRHKSLLLTVPIDTTSKPNFVRQCCYITLWLYYTHLFLRRTRFSVQPLTAHIFASRQTNAVSEDCSCSRTWQQLHWRTKQCRGLATVELVLRSSVFQEQKCNKLTSTLSAGHLSAYSRASAGFTQ